MKMKLLGFVIVLAGWMLTMVSAQATTMVSMSLDQLTEASTDIVQGRVVNQVTAWNPSHTQILTITTVEVTQRFKGDSASTLEVQQMGGTVGHAHSSVSGDVALQPQTEYVFFLEPEPGTARYHLVGMMQGAYHIYQDASSREARVILPLSQVQFQSQMLSGGNPLGTLPLDGLHKYVATILNTGVQIPHGLTIPVAVASTESRGVGRLHVYGRTTSQLFPNASLAIPAGTAVEGDAMLSGGNWTIHWDEMDIRGMHAPIAATSQESAGSLRGRNLVLHVR